MFEVASRRLPIKRIKTSTSSSNRSALLTSYESADCSTTAKHRGCASFATKA